MAFRAEGGNSLNGGANPDADIWSSLSEEPEQPQQLEQQGIDNGPDGLTDIERRLGLTEPYIFESQLRNTGLTTEERREINETRREQFGMVRDAYQEAMQNGDIPRNTQFGNFKTYLENNIHREYAERDRAEQAAREQEIAELLDGRTPEEASEWLRSEIGKYEEEIGYLNQEMADMQSRYESHTSDALQSNLAKEAPTKRYEDQINYDQARIAELQQRLERISALGLSGNGEDGGNQPDGEDTDGNVVDGQPQGGNADADTDVNQPQGNDVDARAATDGAQGERESQGGNQTPGEDQAENANQAQDGDAAQNGANPDRPIDYRIRSQDMGLFPDGHEPEDVAAAWGDAMNRRNGGRSIDYKIRSQDMGLFPDGHEPEDVAAAWGDAMAGRNGNDAPQDTENEAEIEANDANRENNIEGRTIRNEDGSYNEDYLNSDHYQAEKRAEDKFDRIDASLTRAVEEHRMHPKWAEQLRERALREFSIEVDNIRQAYLNGENYTEANPNGEAGEDAAEQNGDNAGPQNGNPNGRVNSDARSQDSGLFPDGHEPGNENHDGRDDNVENRGGENNNTDNNNVENKFGAENTPEKLNEEEEALQADLEKTQAEIKDIVDERAIEEANFTVIEADFDEIVDQLAHARAEEMRDARAKNMRILGGIWNLFLGGRYERKMVRELKANRRNFATDENGEGIGVKKWLDNHKNEVIERMLEAATDSRFLMTDQGETLELDESSPSREILMNCFSWLANARVPEDGSNENEIVSQFGEMIDDEIKTRRDGVGLDIPDFMKTNVVEVAKNIRAAVNHNVGLNKIRDRFNIYYADVRDVNSTVESILASIEGGN